MSSPPCRLCRPEAPLGFDFTMAFQPILDLAEHRVWAWEALVRGPAGEGAGHVLAQLNDANRYRFDQAARVRAIEMAGRLFPGDGTLLSINFMPNAVYEPAACIRASLEAARRVGFSPRRLLFEFTEGERTDPAHVGRIIREYRRQGFATAIDDFGAGYSGLALLADFQPDVVKIDMHLVRNIHADPARGHIVAALVQMTAALDVTLVAEGVETAEEARALRGLGIRLMQGFHFARPALGALPLPAGWSDRIRASA